MYLEATAPKFVNLDGPRQQHRVTVRGDHMRAGQRIHAWAMLLLPPLGAVAALVQALRSGVSLLELSLLGGMYSLTIIGISVGFHRHLTHRAFQAHPAVRAVLTILGSMAGQGPPIYWVSNHRRHHQFSDLPGDPHSPYVKDHRPLTTLRGLWHAHIQWTFDHDISNTFFYCRDLFRDPVVTRINRLYLGFLFLGLVLPALAGAAVTGGLGGALSGFLWGGVLRLFLTYHATSSINSITHVFGSRPFETREQSRNNPWLAIPTFGEAWHNNHHAFPTSAYFGLRASEIDLGGWVVRALASLGLIWDVKRPSSRHRGAAR